jgi:hypothetical protein
MRIVSRAVLAACLGGAGLGSPAQALTLQANLTPYAPGSPTNLSSTMTFTEGSGIPKPMRRLVTYGPAGLRLDLRNILTCTRTKLELGGPRGCPAESRVGFGGGAGAVALGNATVDEPYTLDLFLASRQRGRLAVLIYLSAVAPVPLQLVLTARLTHGPPPYGLGLAVDLPAISTVPGAANASVQSTYISLGGSNVAYYKQVHGRRRLVHIKGLIAPPRCPSGGLHFKAIATFEDHTQSSGSYVAPCPGRRG